MLSTNPSIRESCIHWIVEPFTKPPMHIRSVQTTPPFNPTSDDDPVVVGDEEFVVDAEVATDDGAALTLLGLSSSSFAS